MCVCECVLITGPRYMIGKITRTKISMFPLDLKINLKKEKFSLNFVNSVLVKVINVTVLQHWYGEHIMKWGQIRRLLREKKNDTKWERVKRKFRLMSETYWGNVCYILASSALFFAFSFLVCQLLISVFFTSILHHGRWRALIGRGKSEALFGHDNNVKGINMVGKKRKRIIGNILWSKKGHHKDGVSLDTSLTVYWSKGKKLVTLSVC